MGEERRQALGRGEEGEGGGGGEGYTPTATQTKLQMPAGVLLGGSGKALEPRKAMTLRSWLMLLLMKLLQMAQKENSKGCKTRR